MQIGKKNMLRLLVLLLVGSLLSTVPVNAATGNVAVPYASDYLDRCSCHMTNAGNGKVQTNFSAISAYTMDQLGAKNIAIYESTDNANFTLVKTFTYHAYPRIMGSNTDSHSGSVSYSGIVGRYYKARVIFRGANDSGSDERTVWTNPIRAT